MSLQELTDTFAKAKENFVSAKLAFDEAQANLFTAMYKDGLSSVGTPEAGKATIVYKEDVILTDKTPREKREKWNDLLEAESDAKTDLAYARAARKELEQDLVTSGEAKADKQFSYIKYTKPKK